jgi:predicted nucleotidyltransferase
MNDKSSTKLTYSYGGPVYRFNRIYSDYWEAYTEAVSLKQAINNFNFKAKKAFGFANTANIHIDPDYVVCEDNYPEDTEVEVCQNCGNILNDAGECPLCDLHDESVLDEKLESEELFSMTPYMLRNDGKLLECGELHPYIKMSNSTSYETNLKTLNNHLDFLDWFYNNTLNDETKELIEEFKKEPSEELMNLLNDLTNQEFCRVRTSNYKVKYGGDNGQIYFRISSTGFNWFDLIWNIVFKYSKDIREVTVMKDKQTFGGKEFEYYYDHMPVDEFLSLKGNPVIESYEEDKDRIFNKTNTEKHNTLKPYQDAFEKLTSDWQDLKLDDNSFIEECNKLLTELDNIDKSKVYDVELATLQNNINNFIKRVSKINKLVSKQLEETIEKHDILNPKLFENNELKEEIADKLEEIALTFIDQVKDDEIQIDLKDIVIVGSNVNYNYTKDSDIDLHIIVDSTNIEPEKLYAKIYDLERSNFNSNYDIFVKDIPVEIYVELDEPKGISGGIYSLFTGWVKEPVQKDIPDIDQEAFEKLFTEWEDKYFALLDSTDDEEDIDVKSRSERIDEFIDNLYELRKESIAKDGEFGLGNLVFKEFRNLGYLDNLKELKKQEKSKELSLN